MAESENEKGYEVIDKRKVKLGEDGEVYTEPEAEQVEEKVEAEVDEEAEQEDLGFPPTDVYTMLRSFISLLGMHAWQWMGLIKNPSTNELTKDLVQAKTAIDAIAALASQLEGHADAAEQRELRNMLSDLRINFVQQSSRP